MPLVSDALGAYVFKRSRILFNAVRVHSALVHKCASAYERLVFVDFYIRDLRHFMAQRIQVRNVLHTFYAALELQVRNNGRKIDVAAPFPVSEQRSLDMARARI